MATVCDATQNGHTDIILEEQIDPGVAADRAMKPVGISMPILFWMLFVHLGAALVFFPKFFSWWSVGLMFVLHWLTGGVGVCLGYHRYFTHRGFQTYAPIRYFFAALGALSGEGSVLNWVATHRRHHAYSDEHGDPHSPNDGAWWAHMLWIFPRFDSRDLKVSYQRWIPDMIDDPKLLWLDSMFLASHLLFAGLIYGLGWMFGGPILGSSFVVWGVFARLVFVMHSTWLVNSASHMWGYRNYDTTDDSRNNWFVALVTYGEGWHNNHHAYPTMVRHGHKFWEIDVTYMTIRLMQMLGLAWNVVDHKHKQRAVGNTVVSQASTEAILKAHRKHKTESPQHAVSKDDECAAV